MTPHDLVQAAFQLRKFYGGFETHRVGHVINALARMQLIQKPKPLLGKRCGEDERFGRHYLRPVLFAPREFEPPRTSNMLASRVSGTMAGE